VNSRVFKKDCIFSGTLHGRLVLGLLAGKRLGAITHAEERPARGCIFHAGAGHPGGRGAHGLRLAGALRHAGTNPGDDAVHGGRGRAGEGGRGAADLLQHDGAAATMPGERRVDDTIVQPSVSRDQRYGLQHPRFQRELVRQVVRTQAQSQAERPGDLGRETGAGTCQSVPLGDDYAGDSPLTGSQIQCRGTGYVELNLFQTEFSAGQSITTKVSACCGRA